MIWLAMALAQVPVTDPRLDEISGLELRTTGGFWALEDSGNRAALYAIDLDGTVLGSTRIRGVRNVDFEALTAYRPARGPRLVVVGDVGDNLGIRREKHLYAIPEGALEANLGGKATVMYHWRFTLDEAVDIEAVAVDSRTNDALILTKREEPPVLWRVPLGPGEPERVGAVAIPAPTAQDLAEDPRFGQYRSQPTAMDLDDDGTLYILTYAGLYTLAPSGGGWNLTNPERHDIEQLAQTEAGCLDPTGAYWYTSEGTPTALHRWQPGP